MAESVVGVRVSDGKLLWRYPHKVYADENILTPLFQDGFVIVSGCVRKGSTSLRLSVSGNECSVKQQWHNETLDNKQGGTVIYGGGYGGGYAAPLYPATPYGGYPGYGYGSYPGYGYGSGYDQGYLKHRCGPEGGCVTTYKGPPGAIEYLPRIDRQIRQTRPSYIHIKPKPTPRN